MTHLLEHSIKLSYWGGCIPKILCITPNESNRNACWAEAVRSSRSFIWFWKIMEILDSDRRERSQQAFPVGLPCLKIHPNARTGWKPDFLQSVLGVPIVVQYLFTYTEGLSGTFPWISDSRLHIDRKQCRVPVRSRPFSKIRFPPLPDS